MKDFNDFQKTISQDTIDRWSDEILEKVNPQIEGLDSLEQMVIRSRSLNLQLTMRLLEAYHSWSNQ